MFCRRKPLTAYRVLELKQFVRYNKICNLGLRYGDKVYLINKSNDDIFMLGYFYFKSIDVRYVNAIERFDFLGRNGFIGVRHEQFLAGITNYTKISKYQKDNNLASIEEALKKFNVKIKRPV